MDAVVSDFGLARFMATEATAQKTNSNIGPIRWMAPECLTKQQYSKKVTFVNIE